MPGANKKLDLSQLTDEEAKHVWEVVQRDFDLRKKEEDRLGVLKTRIEREDTKRELLGLKGSLTETHCIRCLQPFKFLVNSRRRCLDCHLFTCKACSLYNKKEHGWVCDPCRMARVLKIGTLEWYHENVRARFKRFGSAKVMRSLFKRLSGEHGSEHSFSPDDFGVPREYDTESMPEVHAVGFEDHHLDTVDSQSYKENKKTKRRLTVDPIDFGLDSDYATTAGGGSNQEPESCSIPVADEGGRESLIAEGEVASVFHHILEEQHKGPGFGRDMGLDLGLSSPADDPYPDYRSVLSRSLSRLSYSSCGSGSAGCPRGSSSYLPGPDDSDEEDDLGDHISRESVSSAHHPPQITDLNRRVSAIETLLNRLEQKVAPTCSTPGEAASLPGSASPLPQWEEADLEEQQLRRKLHEMTGGISDHSLSSEEEAEEQEAREEGEEAAAGCSHQGVPSRPGSRASTAGSARDEMQPQSTDSPKNPLRPPSPRQILPPADGAERRESSACLRGSRALLVELEDKVAQAAADVQNARSEVYNIQNRIAALNAAGLPAERRRKSSIPVQTRRLSHNFPTNQVGRFVRNSQYRGSLTQRNPVAAAKPRATCAKPVMTQGS